MRTLLLILCLLSATTLWAADHIDLTFILRDHVKDGRVNYAALKKDKRLDAYLEAMSRVDVAELKSLARKAYYINVYNAVTLKAVADAWPVASIRDIGGKGSGNVWKQPLVRLRSDTMSLDELENVVLRRLGDPRIHFAVVCAAKGCPTLRNEAYESHNIDGLLDEQTTAFLASPTWNVFDATKKVVRISRIFEWYRKDFADSDKAMLRFLARYGPRAAADDIRMHLDAYRIEYLDYDWRVNAQ